MSVANNAGAVGRLLAIGTLTKGERELLRKQDEPAQETAKPAQQQSSLPIAHNSKAVAGILLNLLNERLQASDAEAMNRQKTPSEARQTATDDATNSPKRVTARYAEDGLIANSDTGRPEAAFPIGQGPLHEATPSAAPELQSFIQRLAAFATGRSDSRTATNAEGARDRKTSGALGGMAVGRIMIVAVAVLWLCALISGWLPG